MTPELLNKFAHACADAPAPLITIFTSESFFFERLLEEGFVSIPGDVQLKSKKKGKNSFKNFKLNIINLFSLIIVFFNLI